MLQQVGQHRIPEQTEFAGAQLQGHMAVAEVISRLQQRQGLGGPHQQQGFGGGLHPHRRIAGLPEQPLAGAQRFAPLELEQQVATAAALAMAPQAGAVIGREGQPQEGRIAGERAGLAAAEQEGGRLGGGGFRGGACGFGGCGCGGCEFWGCGFGACGFGAWEFGGWEFGGWHRIGLQPQGPSPV